MMDGGHGSGNVDVQLLLSKRRQEWKKVQSQSLPQQCFRWLVYPEA